MPTGHRSGHSTRQPSIHGRLHWNFVLGVPAHASAPYIAPCPFGAFKKKKTYPCKSTLRHKYPNKYKRLFIVLVRLPSLQRDIILREILRTGGSISKVLIFRGKLAFPRFFAHTSPVRAVTAAPREQWHSHPTRSQAPYRPPLTSTPAPTIPQTLPRLLLSQAELPRLDPQQFRHSPAVP
jgi:hypothetical protein